MINKDELLDVLNHEGPFLKNQLYLWDWSISPLAGKLGKNLAGLCRRQTPYRQATITVDPAEVASKKEARKVLRHELLHLVTARIWQVDTVAAPHLSKKARKAFRRVLGDVEEELVGHLEAILDIGIGAPLKPPKPKKKKRKKKRKGS